MEEAAKSIAVARQRPFVESFVIEGLYGYRTVSLSSQYAATVLIARNGAGKTTLLAALDAFLRGQFIRFFDLEFQYISCKLRENSEELVVTKADVLELAELAGAQNIVQRAKVWDIPPLELLSFLETDIEKLGYEELYENPVFYAAYTKSTTGQISVTKDELIKLAQQLDLASPNLAVLRRKIRTLLSGLNIIYLPTYRRIELSLPRSERRGDRKRSVLARLGANKVSLYGADIQFGLSDIPDRLKALHQQMLSLSNQGYGKISANIINDLMSDNFKKGGLSRENWPSKDSLELFFSRIRDSEREYRRGPYFGPGFINIPDLDRVYKGDVPQDAQAFLGYFLGQLNSVIEQTKGTEDLVGAFISSCNGYLSGEDGLPCGSEEGVSDSKRLTFNRKDLRVRVISSATGRKVPLESLSSGEKQMISLFARLYLYPGRKLILIDEPELSLSLNWQRKIVPDILGSPGCEQVVAITHSPFIFDNELEPFATSLRLRLRTPPEGISAPLSEFDSGDLDWEDEL
jgi:energy-coupling factor transporter ATP-binding protein EcfA2